MSYANASPIAPFSRTILVDESHDDESHSEEARLDGRSARMASR